MNLTSDFPVRRPRDSGAAMWPAASPALTSQLLAAVYAARESPPADLPTAHAPLLAALRAACERRQGRRQGRRSPQLA